MWLGRRIHIHIHEEGRFDWIGQQQRQQKRRQQQHDGPHQRVPIVDCGAAQAPAGDGAGAFWLAAPLCLVGGFVCLRMCTTSELGLNGAELKYV